MERGMLRKPLWAALGLALATAGCGDLISLHPLCAPGDRVLEAALEGRWENEDNVLTVTRAGSAYEVALRGKTAPIAEQEYEVSLLELGGVRMADLVLSSGEIGHMFVRVRVKEGDLRFAFLDSAWLRQRLPHEAAEVAKGNTLAVLVAPTGELRKQIEKYVRVAEAYDDEIVYQRLPAAAPR
jgi:hypothetical protein